MKKTYYLLILCFGLASMASFAQDHQTTGDIHDYRNACNEAIDNMSKITGSYSGFIFFIRFNQHIAQFVVRICKSLTCLFAFFLCTYRDLCASVFVLENRRQLFDYPSTGTDRDFNIILVKQAQKDAFAI